MCVCLCVCVCVCARTRACVRVRASRTSSGRWVAQEKNILRARHLWCGIIASAHALSSIVEICSATEAHARTRARTHTHPWQLRERCALCSAANQDLRHSVSSLEQGKTSLEGANRLLATEVSEARKDLVATRAAHKQCATALAAREADVQRLEGELRAERGQAAQMRSTIEGLESKLKALAPVWRRARRSADTPPLLCGRAMGVLVRARRCQ